MSMLVKSIQPKNENSQVITVHGFSDDLVYGLINGRYYFQVDAYDVDSVKTSIHIRAKDGKSEFLSVVLVSSFGEFGWDTEILTDDTSEYALENFNIKVHNSDKSSVTTFVTIEVPSDFYIVQMHNSVVSHLFYSEIING